MSQMIVVDASVWVASLVQHDVFHSTARDWLRNKHHQGVELLSPTLLLAEVAGAISRQSGKPALARQLVETIRRLPGLTLVDMNFTLIERATRLAADLGLRGADAIYVAVADYLHAPLATLDQQQSARACQVVRAGLDEL